MKPSYSFGASNSPKSFQAYPRGDFDLETGIGIAKRSRKPKKNLLRMIKSLGNRIQHYFKLHPLLLFLICLSIGILVLFLFSVYNGDVRMMSTYRAAEGNVDSYPFAYLRNLVMVAGHSIYTSSSCDKVEKEDAWYLEPYQKHPGQAATFVTHIEKGVEIAATDDAALLLFSGGETRRMLVRGAKLRVIGSWQSPSNGLAKMQEDRENMDAWLAAEQAARENMNARLAATEAARQELLGEFSDLKEMYRHQQLLIQSLINEKNTPEDD